MEKYVFSLKKDDQLFIIFKYFFPLIVFVIFALFYSRNPDYDALAESLFLKTNTYPNPIDVFWNGLTHPDFNANPYAHILSDPVHDAIGSLFFYFVHESYIALALSAAVFAGLCVFMLINIFELSQKSKSKIIVYTLLSFSGAFIYIGTESSTSAFQVFFLLLWLYLFLKCSMEKTRPRYLISSVIITALLPFVYLGYALIIVWLIFIAICFLVIGFSYKKDNNSPLFNSLISFRFWLYYFTLSLIIAVIVVFINALFWNISIISYFLDIIPADQRYGLGSLVGFSSGLPTSPFDFFTKVYFGIQYFLVYISPSITNFLSVNVSTRIGIIIISLGIIGMLILIVVALAFSLLYAFKDKQNIALFFILFSLFAFNITWWSFWDILPKFWVIPYFLLLMILNAEFYVPRGIGQAGKKFIVSINKNFAVDRKFIGEKTRIVTVGLILTIFLIPNGYAMVQSNISNDSGLVFAQNLQNFIDQDFKNQTFVVICRSTEYMVFQYVFSGNSHINSIWLIDLTQKQFDDTVHTTNYLIYTAILENPTPIKVDIPIPLWLQDYVSNATLFFSQSYSNVYLLS